ncbi:MAG: flagellin [Ignavibacteriales bacterium]|nr:flagellin [Ignavibacteriales bacterium]
MRVTESSINATYLYNQQQVLKRKTQIQIELATNSRIQTLSDDVTGSLESIKLNSQIKKTDTYVQNGVNAKQFMNSSLQSLDNMTVEIQKIMTTCVDADNPLNVQNYGTMVQSIKDSLTAIVQNMTAKHNGMPLFGGTNFQSDPVTIDVNGKAVISAEDFSGVMQAQISQDVKQTYNIPGSKLLGTGIFDSINNIIDSLTAGTAPTKAQQTDLENAYNAILNVQSLGGQSINRMDDLNQMLTTQTINLQEMLSNKQGVDVAALTVELQNKDYLLQITNKLLANNYPKSLFDYL